ncbi:MAG: tRNA uridine-5-carboxymethylaminomethyl(34) synthesis GTPase MnmE [Clostridia bacterium]
MNETITAISTPPVTSAIGIVRISGPNTPQVVDKIFKPTYSERLSTSPSRKMTIGTLFSREDVPIDHCLAVFMKGPNTYTGEDMAEIQCHGSTAILEETLKNCVKNGARLALAGEFTKRAFLSGKLDLSASEAVSDIISAKTLEVAQNAVGQLGGVVENKITKISNDVVELIAHFHALVDYPDEEIDPFTYENSLKVLTNATNELFSLAKSFEKGKIMRDGIDCAIIGKPNVGKSSILNALSGKEKAIVTNIAGTTRDIIEEYIKVGPIALKLSDTAGLRETTDEVEKIGVERAIENVANSKIVLAVFDGNQKLDCDDMLAISKIEEKNCIAIINKSDLERNIDMQKITQTFAHVVEISAKNNVNMEKITEKILEIIGMQDISYNGEIITNARQAEAIERAGNRCKEALNALQMGMTPDAVTMDAEGAMVELSQITGKSVTEDVINKIFENFCVGK